VVTVALGSDAAAPDPGCAMFRHMAQCLHDHSRHFPDPHVMMPRDVLEMCTIDAAKAIGLEDEGPLEAVKKADIVMLNRREPHLYPAVMPLTTIPQFANAAYVETVIMNGNIRMRDRKTTLNEATTGRRRRGLDAALARNGLTHLLFE
jgi:cytosine/adenosine deaminase-related metal-dependent hydrolase